MNTLERILSLINQNNLNAAQFLREAKLNSSSLNDWKKGKANPSYGALVKIANYFNVSVEYLECKTDEPNPEPELAKETKLAEGFRYAFGGKYMDLDDEDIEMLQGMADFLIEKKRQREENKKPLKK